MTDPEPETAAALVERRALSGFRRLGWGVTAELEAIGRALTTSPSPLQRALQTVYNTPLFKEFEESARFSKLLERLQAAGWLPHHSTPLTLLREAGALDREALSKAVEAHLKQNWTVILQGFSDRLHEATIDDEGKATFSEALEAHSAGLFRVAPRLLFPEVERLTRAHFSLPESRSLASQRPLKEALAGLYVDDFGLPGALGFEIFKAVYRRIYENVLEMTALEAARRSSIPNRHAAIHGLVSYSTFQTSYNALVITEFLYAGLGALQARSLGPAP